MFPSSSSIVPFYSRDLKLSLQGLCHSHSLLERHVSSRTFFTAKRRGKRRDMTRVLILSEYHDLLVSTESPASVVLSATKLELFRETKTCFRLLFLYSHETSLRKTYKTTDLTV